MHDRTPIPLEVRERILAAYDAGEGTKEAIARRFRVSLGMVKKLLLQRQKTGSIAPKQLIEPLHKVLPSHQRRMRALLSQKPDLTLRELRSALGLKCSVQAIHKALRKMGLTVQYAKILPSDREQMRALLAKKPDLTLRELRSALGLTCSVAAVGHALGKMGLAFEKRLSEQQKKDFRCRVRAGHRAQPIRRRLPLEMVEDDPLGEW
jgi:transposase